ncbi:MarR family winged helix-turn-helix transcriptional regulator [Amycolatopsis sp. FDAARGOS 1241]|uniref:MarR family winged helix-turn-helix transcriptional regulator n=1 Tax=Amycolatopsis sp. FDAARGOS 1241 TaxID=2778070 RepID=UPI001950E681|nr:MarR family winged helix-turn-helix transcriptional regulator [Amycolatopsis sp. FDAARGOS 1241]QRP43416.1 winged helix-turn-helix transcriptional regulator [Amycolatopsis sp. FDAARGOS 1241]
MPSSGETREHSALGAVRALARASRLLERSSGELNLAHYRVLSAIASGDERASRVARRLALGRPAISAAVDALTRRGLVVRGGVDADHRATALSLTPEGERLLAATEGEMIARITALVARTPDPERVLEALSWLDTAIDEVMAERMAETK